MIMEKVVIKNFKIFRNFELSLVDDVNIVVGDNETGKSTLLEAINLALTGQMNGKSIASEISPFIFNKDAVSEYIEGIRKGVTVPLPPISIELYLKETPELAEFRGNNNSKREDAVGVTLLIVFDEEYVQEYQRYIEKKDEIQTLPTEYYTFKWYSFAHNRVTQRGFPIKTSLIDAATIRLQYGTDHYLRTIIENFLDPKERTELSLSYRRLKELFSDAPAIKEINKKLQAEQNTVSNKKFSVSIDISSKTSWETNLTSYLDDIPFQHIGKGEQNIVKTMLALHQKARDAQVLLIEEPENHLSFSTMTQLMKRINDACLGKQMIISTHSTFVLNKLGIDKAILLNRPTDGIHITTFKDLKSDTQSYFKRLPGYDTLRLLLAKQTILVEGPSDELFVQKAYSRKHSCLPIENGIDVISVRGLSFRRFLELAVKLRKPVTVVTDNDGDIAKFQNKYDGYLNNEYPFIKICYDTDTSCVTLEPQIVKNNDLKTLNKILGRNDKAKAAISAYMSNNKTEVALKFFETDETFTIPEYIRQAVE